MGTDLLDLQVRRQVSHECNRQVPPCLDSVTYNVQGCACHGGRLKVTQGVRRTGGLEAGGGRRGDVGTSNIDKH